MADLNCSNYAQVIGPGTITWVASGGSPGAFIRSTDPTSACYSYDSPAAFEGNRSEYVGGSLRWRIRTNIADCAKLDAGSRDVCISLSLPTVPAQVSEAPKPAQPDMAKTEAGN